MTLASITCLLLAQTAELEPLHGRQRMVAILIALGVLALVLELLRRRKLREEYSWLWIATATLLVVLAVWPDLIVLLSRLIGAATPTSTLFLGCLLFLLAVALQVSVRLSKMTARQKALGQRVAMLEAELDQRQEGAPDRDGDPVPMRQPPTRPEIPVAKDGVA